MKIIRTYDDPYYPEKSRFLGNCYNLIIEDRTYHFEFIIKKNSALVLTDNLDYIENVIQIFHNDNAYISSFYTKDSTFYKSYDEKIIFKLPISILQVSNFFLQKEKLNQLEQYLDENEIYLPVCIIDEEYVLLDGHHRLYLAAKNLNKMVYVYMDDIKPSTHDFVYIAKEQNIRFIKDLKIISTKDYQEIMKEFELLTSYD